MKGDAECGCAGGMCCGKQPRKPRVTRRDFMKTAAAGGAGLMLAGRFAAAANALSSPEDYGAWLDDLFKRGGQRWYGGEELTHIAMPLGGIGAGQVYLTGFGTLDPWQVVNNFNENASAPGSMFGVWTKTAAGNVLAKRLELGDDADAIADLEFSGEYPYAWIRYQDEALPIAVSLEAWSPFIPLNAKDSALPAVLFRFSVKNTTAEVVETALMASAPNLIGWDGYAELEDHRYMGYIGNRNRIEQGDSADVLRFETSEGSMASLGAPSSLLTNVEEVAFAMQLCGQIEVRLKLPPGLEAPVSMAAPFDPRIFWIDSISKEDADTDAAQMLDAVEQGASFILSGETNSLLAALAQDRKSIPLPREARERWIEALPLTWTQPKLDAAPVRAKTGAPLFEGIAPDQAALPYRWGAEELSLRDGAEVLVEAEDGTPLVIAGQHGDGRIIVCLAPVHSLAEPADRKRVIGNLVAFAAGTAYTPQTGWTETAPYFGSMVLAVLGADDRSALPQWVDSKAMWQDFAEDGRFSVIASDDPSAAGQTWNGALSVPLTLAPGEEKQVSFALAWHFPNRMKDWRYGLGPPAPQMDFRLGNQYNNWFSDAPAVVDYLVENFERLERETRLFHDTFYDSTLPHWLLDGITANLSTLRSPIIMWLEDGTVAGFEGSDACCPMNCTHVYNYAMSAAFLFPALERRVREIDLLLQMNPEGHFIPHRTLLPLSLPRMGDASLGPWRHALDGELGTILKTCREWQVTGDTEWLKTLWPNLKLVMQHVFDDHDPRGEGVIRGEQPNTYDILTYGSNTFIGTIYLATLRATEEMARHLGDTALAEECRTRFEKGSKAYDATCWAGRGGSFYRHLYDAPSEKPGMYEQDNSWGPGCHSDQLFGQWWADILNLGDLLPRDHLQGALHSIYDHNWVRDLSGHVHSQRVFAAGQEKGLLNCSWPNGGRPTNPVKYCDEVWTGIEYHVAASLIRHGRYGEGLQIAKGARDRYTGDQRNPWCEVECGGHYARAMSSYGLLLAASDFSADGRAGVIRFASRMDVQNVRCFFSTGHCWGVIEQRREKDGQYNRIEVTYGLLTLSQWELELADGVDSREIDVAVRVPAGVSIDARRLYDNKCLLLFSEPLSVQAGSYIEVYIDEGSFKR
ncbi:MAG: twin-arginine translocation signal domain-containing protein [Candidatus Hydrogenedentes bacterium]|nr:twin-arginine translocation signal domain-containing protein [Candidatus Hydrogenedentota bacterium]